MDKGDINPEFENDVFRMYWYDAERTIFVGDVLRRWTWDDALELVRVTNEIYATFQYPYYAILNFMPQAAYMPRDNTSIVANLNQLLRMDETVVKLRFYTGQIHIFKAFLRATTAVHDLFGQTATVRYARNRDEALAKIAQHKAEMKA